MQDRIEPVLVMGIGNILQSDDGVGVHVVNSIISGELSFQGVEFIDGGTAGMDLLPLMIGRKKIVIVDALKVDDSPGSIYRFPAERLYEKNDHFSLHDVGVKRIIDMLSLMGENPEVEIVGIVPEDIDTVNIGMSDPVKKAVDKAVEIVLESAV